MAQGSKIQFKRPSLRLLWYSVTKPTEAFRNRRQRCRWDCCIFRSLVVGIQAGITLLRVTLTWFRKVREKT